jgi:hypothetical protein
VPDRVVLPVAAVILDVGRIEAVGSIDVPLDLQDAPRALRVLAVTFRVRGAVRVLDDVVRLAEQGERAVRVWSPERPSLARHAPYFFARIGRRFFARISIRQQKMEPLIFGSLGVLL